MTRTKISDNGAILTATLTCPHCHAAQEVTMAEGVCVGLLTCRHCATQIHTPDGACCVFCGHADVPCPDAQLSGKSCCYND